MSWRSTLPPASEWMTVAEWSSHVGASVNTAYNWIRQSKIQGRPYPWPADLNGNRKPTITMVAAHTPRPRRSGRQGDRINGKRFFKRGPLTYARDAPELAKGRGDFAERLQRLLARLTEWPGDLKATRWMLKALDGHHTTVGLGRELAITADELLEYKRTGRTPAAVDDRALVLAAELLAHLSAPSDKFDETLEHYAEARRGDPIEGGGY